jgi:hypothetical protein
VVASEVPLGEAEALASTEVDAVADAEGEVLALTLLEAEAFGVVGTTTGAEEDGAALVGGVVVGGAVVGGAVVGGAVVGGAVVGGAVVGGVQSPSPARTWMVPSLGFASIDTFTVQDPPLFHGTPVKVATPGLSWEPPTTVSSDPTCVWPSYSLNVAVVWLVSTSCTVMVAVPVERSQPAEPVKSPTLQAKALPATPSARAPAAEATPRERTAKAVRRDMDTSSPNWTKPERLQPHGLTSATRTTGVEPGGMDMTCTPPP